MRIFLAIVRSLAVCAASMCSEVLRFKLRLVGQLHPEQRVLAEHTAANRAAELVDLIESTP